MRRDVWAVLLMVLVSGCSSRQSGDAGASREVPANVSTAAKFDPARDPVRDLAAAVVEAQRTKRRIILDVGGEWCKWCHILDGFIRDHPEVNAAIARDFVWLKINFSPENENAAFLSGYPAIAGYPHLFVLNTDGSLLHSQNTAELELGPSYDLDILKAFLARWSPAQSRGGGA